MHFTYVGMIVYKFLLEDMTEVVVEVTQKAMLMTTLNFLLGFHCWLCYAGTSAGVGFAIPSSTVLKIALQLIQFSKVSCLLVDSSFSFLGRREILHSISRRVGGLASNTEANI